MAISLVPYDDEWPKIFGELKESVCKLIPYQIEVEHVGSTAVVGLGGKGIIDILVIASRKQLEKLGIDFKEPNYAYANAFPNQFCEGPKN